jgi:hypothetical protein
MAVAGRACPMVLGGGGGRRGEARRGESEGKRAGVWLKRCGQMWCMSRGWGGEARLYAAMHQAEVSSVKGGKQRQRGNGPQRQRRDETKGGLKPHEGMKPMEDEGGLKR